MLRLILIKIRCWIYGVDRFLKVVCLILFFWFNVFWIWVIFLLYVLGWEWIFLRELKVLLSWLIIISYCGDFGIIIILKKSVIVGIMLKLII